MALRHLHHYRFWLPIVIALLVLAGAHYMLFGSSNVGNVPSDLLHSPDAMLFLATVPAFVVLALLIRSGHPKCSITRSHQHNRQTNHARLPRQY